MTQDLKYFIAFFPTSCLIIVNDNSKESLMPKDATYMPSGISKLSFKKSMSANFVYFKKAVIIIGQHLSSLAFCEVLGDENISNAKYQELRQLFIAISQPIFQQNIFETLSQNIHFKQNLGDRQLEILQILGNCYSVKKSEISNKFKHFTSLSSFLEQISKKNLKIQGSEVKFLLKNQRFFKQKRQNVE